MVAITLSFRGNTLLIKLYHVKYLCVYYVFHPMFANSSATRFDRDSYGMTQSYGMYGRILPLKSQCLTGAWHKTNTAQAFVE